MRWLNWFIQGGAFLTGCFSFAMAVDACMRGAWFFALFYSVMVVLFGFIVTVTHENARILY